MASKASVAKKVNEHIIKIMQLSDLERNADSSADLAPKYIDVVIDDIESRNDADIQVLASSLIEFKNKTTSYFVEKQVSSSGVLQTPKIAEYSDVYYNMLSNATIRFLLDEIF